MSLIQGGLIALVLLLIVGWWVLRRRDAAEAAVVEERADTIAGWPPQATRVLTSHERMTYQALAAALPECMILAQVPMSRFLTVPKRNSYADWLRRLGYQCVDFAVCDSATQVIAVIELEPPGGPQTERARKRAKRMARALEAAEIRLIVWSEDSVPAREAVRNAVLPKPKPVAASAVIPLVPTVKLPPRPEAVMPNPFEDAERDTSNDETIEMLEPPPSTWFDEFDSEPGKLAKR